MREVVNLLTQLPTSVWVLLAIVLAVALFKPLLRMLGVVIVPEHSIGLVNKVFTLIGEHKTLPDGRIVALRGEAGYQADTLAPGLYFGYFPWQYRITLQKFIAIPEDHVGVVEAKDGVPIPVGRVLGQHIECDMFQNARKFLAGAGQRGPQLDIIPPGTYRINTALFTVQVVKALEIPENKVGIVTTQEGAPLPTGEIAGREILGHAMFQNAHAFVEQGGFKGLQEQVMLAGTYYTNPNFMSVELVEMTSVPIGHVGVVVAYVGASGEDISGDNFKHGNIVSRGHKGVWQEPLDPGKYPINPHTNKVELVPTTNIVLNWANAKSESHNLDQNLSTITVRSADGFTFNLDVSQIIHVSRHSASKVIARFGNMANLVTQVLEPLIGNYFRNSAQKNDVIDFLRGRAERQAEARKHIEDVLGHYDVQGVDTLIGDIVPPHELMKTLTDRKVAEQSEITFQIQRNSEVQRQELEKAKAEADTRGQIVSAARRAEIAELEARAAVNAAKGAAESRTINAEADARAAVNVARGAAESRTINAEAEARAVVNVARGEAESKTLNADADARVLQLVGEAEAAKTRAIGAAQAAVLQQKVDSVGAQYYSLMEIAAKLAEHNVALVPTVMVGGGGEKSGGTIVDAMIGTSLAQTLAATNAQGAARKDATGLPSVGTRLTPVGDGSG